MRQDGRTQVTIEHLEKADGSVEPRKMHTIVTSTSDLRRQISDTILNARLTAEPRSKAACETATKDNMVAGMGEITTQAKLDYDKIIRLLCG